MPLLGYAFAPDWTEDAVAALPRLARPQRPPRRRRSVAAVIGALLILRGVITALASAAEAGQSSSGAWPQAGGPQQGQQGRAVDDRQAALAQLHPGAGEAGDLVGEVRLVADQEDVAAAGAEGEGVEARRRAARSAVSGSIPSASQASRAVSAARTLRAGRGRRRSSAPRPPAPGRRRAPGARPWASAGAPRRRRRHPRRRRVAAGRSRSDPMPAISVFLGSGSVERLA